MGSAKAPRQSMQPPQAPAPQYGSAYENANTNTSQTFTPWGRAQGTYDYMGDLMQQQALAGPQFVGPSDYTQASYGYGQGANQSLGQAAGMAPGIADAWGQAAGNQSGVSDIARQNYGFLSTAADVANNPYVQGMLGTNSQQVNEQLKESWLPAIQGSAVAAGSGAMGSSRAGLAQGQAVGRASQQLANANSGMMLDAYGKGLGAQQYALGQTGALQDAYGASARSLQQQQGAWQNAAALQNAQQQNSLGMGQLYEGYQQAAQDAPWKHLQNLGAAQQYLSPLGTLKGDTKASGYSASGAEGKYGPNGPVAPSATPPDWYNQPPPWMMPQTPYSNNPYSNWYNQN